MDNSQIEQYASVIADAAEESVPEKPVVYVQTKAKWSTHVLEKIKIIQINYLSEDLKIQTIKQI